MNKNHRDRVPNHVEKVEVFVTSCGYVALMGRTGNMGNVAYHLSWHMGYCFQLHYI